MMRIELTQKQYDALVKLIALGNWMANAHRVEQERIVPFDELERHIRAAARGERGDGAISQDAETGAYYATWEVDDDPVVSNLVDEYDNDTFWDELLHRLVERDLERVYGHDILHDPEHRTTLEEPFISRWDDELTEHGIQRLDAAEE